MYFIKLNDESLINVLTIDSVMINKNDDTSIIILYTNGTSKIEKYNSASEAESKLLEIRKLLLEGLKSKLVKMSNGLDLQTFFDNHIANTTLHKSTLDRTKLSNLANNANETYATKNEVNGLRKVYYVDTTIKRDELELTENNLGDTCWVIDATHDITVKSGSALYGWYGSYWVKLSETESLDLSINWNDINDRPESLPVNIDKTVKTIDTILPSIRINNKNGISLKVVGVDQETDFFQRDDLYICFFLYRRRNDAKGFARYGKYRLLNDVEFKDSLTYPILPIKLNEVVVDNFKREFVIEYDRYYFLNRVLTHMTVDDTTSDAYNYTDVSSWGENFSNVNTLYCKTSSSKWMQINKDRPYFSLNFGVCIGKPIHQIEGQNIGASGQWIYGPMERFKIIGNFRHLEGMNVKLLPLDVNRKLN